jgi:hypothetical protein
MRCMAAPSSWTSSPPPDGKSRPKSPAATEAAACVSCAIGSEKRRDAAAPIRNRRRQAATIAARIRQRYACSTWRRRSCETAMRRTPPSASFRAT